MPTENVYRTKLHGWETRAKNNLNVTNWGNFLSLGVVDRAGEKQRPVIETIKLIVQRLMSDQRRRRWTNVKSTLGQRTCLLEIL